LAALGWLLNLSFSGSADVKRRLTPLGLVTRDYGEFNKGILLVGAQANAEAGNVSAVVVTGLIAQLGPLCLTSKPRTFSSKDISDDVFVNITGAAIQGQFNHPDSANTKIFIDSGAILGQASLGPSATLIGSLSDGVLESDLAFGLEDVSIILTAVEWISGQAFNDIRQAIIDGFDSSGTELQGWNVEVRDKINLAAITRVSDTQIRISLIGFSGYSIDVDETITVTVPREALTLGFDIIATPTFSVTADVLSGTQIVNTDTATAPSNYLMCDRTNFKVRELKKEWTGYMVRPESFENQHPQDFLKSRGSDKQRGPLSPEPENQFITTEITGDDL